MTEAEFPDALPPGHRLHWYVLERVLGQGGFGITYLAQDTNLQRQVAIKEYLPAEIARRRSDASARPSTESHAERFAWGLDRFLAEARTLARFEHSNIVRVLSIFEANGTAYMVMRFEKGEDLGTLLRRRGTLSQQEILDVLLPLLAGLQLVHASGYIHRDIKPENIYLREDGSPVLLDFGSARQSFGGTKAMTVLVAPGYAPLEQYYGDAKTQGPWTDIYGLAATCYRAATGRAPLDAIARAKGVLGSTRDLLEPVMSLAEGRYDPRLLSAIDHALQLSERDRPQNVAEWLREIEPPIAMVDPLIGERKDNAPRRGALLHLDTSATTHLPEAVPAQRRTRPDPPARVGAFVPPLSRAGLPWVLGVVLFTVVAVPLGLGLKTSSPSDATFAKPPQQLTPLDKEPSAPVVPTRPAMTRVPTVASFGAVAVSAPTAGTSAPSPEAARAERRVGSPPMPPAVQRLAVRAISANESTGAARDLAETSKAHSLPGTVVTPPVAGSATLATGASPRSALAASEPTHNAPPAAQPISVQAASPAVALVVGAAQPSKTLSSPRRDEQLDAAESALRRGDASGAAQIASPWAAAGVSRAQTLLGRAQEARSREQHSDFEAYVWYGIAARNGEPVAQGLRDKVAGRLQPAEIRQAEQIIEHWKPVGEGPP